MQEKIKTLSKNKLVRYLFSGGLSYAIELGCLLFLHIVVGLPSVVSIAISFWVGLVVSFLLQKLLTFSDRTKSVKRLAGQSLAYGILVVINYAFTLLFVFALENIIGLVVARTGALVITTVWNFVIYKKIIFKDTASTPEENQPKT
jgi:putative flippase GtrA